MSQHAGPLGGRAEEGQRAQEAQSQREEEQEAQVRVVGSDNGGAPVIEEYDGHGAGKEGADQGNNQQSNAYCVTKGEKLHLFGDTGCPVSIGPELRLAARTFYGIYRKIGKCKGRFLSKIHFAGLWKEVWKRKTVTILLLFSPV